MDLTLVLAVDDAKVLELDLTSPSGAAAFFDAVAWCCRQPEVTGILRDLQRHRTPPPRALRELVDSSTWRTRLWDEHRTPTVSRGIVLDAVCLHRTFDEPVCWVGDRFRVIPRQELHGAGGLLTAMGVSTGPAVDWQEEQRSAQKSWRPGGHHTGRSRAPTDTGTRNAATLWQPNLDMLDDIDHFRDETIAALRLECGRPTTSTNGFPFGLDARGLIRTYSFSRSCPFALAFERGLLRLVRPEEISVWCEAWEGLAEPGRS